MIASNNKLCVLNDSNRVYHTWCNGNEHFYYQAGVKDLNSFLARVAAVSGIYVTVTLSSDPGETQSFEKKKIVFSWMLNLKTGIAAAACTEKQRKTLAVTVFTRNETLPEKSIAVPESCNRMCAISASVTNLLREYTSPGTSPQLTRQFLCVDDSGVRALYGFCPGEIIQVEIL